MENAGLDETQAGIWVAGRKSVTSDMQITLLSYGRKQRGTEEPLDESEKEE